MNGDSFMKRLLLLFSCALLLSCLGPLPTCSAQDAQGASAGHKTKSRWHWFHHEKKPREKSDPVQSTQKSGGWWHHGGRNAGPAGAGADQKIKQVKVHREKQHSEKTAPLYTVPKTVGHWFRRGPGPAGAGS